MIKRGVTVLTGVVAALAAALTWVPTYLWYGQETMWRIGWRSQLTGEFVTPTKANPLSGEIVWPILVAEILLILALGAGVFVAWTAMARKREGAIQ